MTEVPDEKQMKLRYAGTCRRCGTTLAARVEAIYERRTKTVRCLTCSPTTETPAPPQVEEAGPPTQVEDAALAPQVEEAGHGRLETPQPETGTAGASARREYERRHAKREDRIRKKHPKLGGFLLAITDAPQTTRAWDAGALGEERLGQRLDELSSKTLRVLHDRRIPGTRANIDHLVVTPTGVYVIDAKRYVGKRPSLRVEGGILRARTEKLMVGSRDQTKLVDGVLKQVDFVRSIVGDRLPVTGVLCFVESEWPLIGGAFTTRGVEVLWPKKLYPRLAAEGPHHAWVVDVHAQLAAALLPA